MVTNAFIDIDFDCDGVCFHAKDSASIDFFKHFSKFEDLKTTEYYGIIKFIGRVCYNLKLKKEIEVLENSDLKIRKKVRFLKLQLLIFIPQTPIGANIAFGAHFP